MADRVQVALGVIYNAKRDAVLISKRRAGQHLGGLWEFPGGKLEPGESAEAALRRELYEELGIKAAAIAGLVDVRHDYQDKRLLCRVWRVYAWRGDIRARENQALSWAPLDKLERYAFPEANRAILAALRLPPVYLISEPSCEDKGRCLAVLEQCLRAGLRLFQLRMEAPGGQPDEALFIAELKSMLGRYAAKLIINGAPAAMRKYQADGIHLNSRALFRYSSRPVAADRLLGASCHNEREIARAARIGADYIFISPVKPTKSHPGSKAIGWQRFESLCRLSPVPVYALGGLTAADLPAARKNGAHGLALLSAVWDAARPDAVIRACIKAAQA